jgi:hypothetical protein
MCHPALSVIAPDEAFRLHEYRFLSSMAFATMLDQYNTRAAGWRATLDKDAGDDAAFCPG